MSLLKKAAPFEERWPEWRLIVQKLLEQHAVTRDEWQGLFSDVHQVISWEENGAESVLRAIMEEIEAHVLGVVNRLQNEMEETALLKVYRREWERYRAQSFYLPQPFRPIEPALHHKDTGHILVRNNSQAPVPVHAAAAPQNDKTLLLQRKMLFAWNVGVFKSVCSRLLSSAMKLITLERGGEVIEGSLVIAVRESFVLMTDDSGTLSVYISHFEDTYINETRSYYEHRAQDFEVANGIYSYLVYATEKFEEEMARGLRYLETRSTSNSTDRLRHCLVSCLVDRVREFIEAEFPVTLGNSDVVHLNRMFRLLDLSSQGVQGILRLLENYIFDCGLQDMKRHAGTIVSDPEKYVEKLLSLFKQYTHLIEEAFDADARFLTIRDKAFRRLVNDTSVFRMDLTNTGDAGAKRGAIGSRSPPESRCPELLANYCDQLLRKTPLSRKLTSDEIDDRLKDVVLLLKYVQNGDVFMRFHQMHLMRRLISETSTDSEKEEDVVQWLRHGGMPAEYVTKLSRMFQDIKISNDVNSAFKEFLRDKDLASLASMANIKILNHGAWSKNSERVTVSLPMELEDFIPEAEQFYSKAHSGRRLTWHHNLSSGIITMTTDVGSYDLEVTTFQMAVLFAWNQRPQESLSLADLALATELGDVELRRTVWSLSHMPKLKRQLLLVEPSAKNPREFTPETSLRINHQFAVIRNNEVQRRGKVSYVGKLQLVTERVRDEVGEGIIALRILRLQEAIVKIMKMRMTIKDNVLQMELIQILRNMFAPTKRMIKEQVEWLIDHGYMKRDADAIDTYIYVA
ncbi:cullin-5-like [Sycon ciliatum]|uniref:cullin-5-like n=1 Tax=Sycon ciliatum TaxID=27933 RepID=UPI0031F6FE03